MVTIEFKYDIIKDSSNIWDSFNNRFHHKVTYLLDINIESEIKGKRWEKVSNFIIEKNKKYIQKHGIFIEAILQSCYSYWQINGDEIINIIEGIFKKEFYSNNLSAYLTLCSRSPYCPKENSFMISILADPTQLVYTFAHELFHLQAYKSFANIFLPKNSIIFEDVMETLTTILDTEYRKTFPLKAISTSTKTILRDKAEELWFRTNDINDVADELFKLYKNRD